jgi:hypothetical protein
MSAAVITAATCTAVEDDVGVATRVASTAKQPVVEAGGGGLGDGGGGDAAGARGPQSTQSEPSGHDENSAPGPPSSQSLSLA